MHIKFDFENKGLEWYKNGSIFVKWDIQNNSDALVATQIKRKNEKSQLRFV